MERSMTPPSVLDRLSITVRDNLPATIVLVLSAVLAIVIALTAGASQLVNALVTGGMWALLAAGLALVFGVMNIPQFAHGESFMVGTYVGYFTFTWISDYLETNPSGFLSFMAPNMGVIAAFVVGAIMGAVLERLIFAPLRRRTRVGWVMNTFLLTVGLSFILVNGTTLVLGPNYRGIPRYYDVPPIEFLGVRIAVDRIWAFAIALITLAILTLFLQRTRTGRAIRAVASFRNSP